MANILTQTIIKDQKGTSIINHVGMLHSLLIHYQNFAIKNHI